MPVKTQRSERRSDALSKERIVEAAVAILDARGEGALTFRTLATRLATGSGAIYWHVADKNELLAATTDYVIGRAVATVAADAEPRQAIRALALGVFDAIDAHPWVGTQLAREPWQAAMSYIFEGVGRQLQALDVPVQIQFVSASALVGYILGVASQNAANARLVPNGTDRSAFLANVAERWTRLAPEQTSFVRQVADQLRDHDDRAQFLAGIDLILAGIEATR